MSDSTRPRRRSLRPHAAHLATIIAIASLTMFVFMSPIGPSGHTRDELFVKPVNATRPNIPSAAHSAPAPPTFPQQVETFIGSIGSNLLDLLGVETDADAMDRGAYGAGGLASWAESSVFVEVRVLTEHCRWRRS